jgi:hypothetical protein
MEPPRAICCRRRSLSTADQDRLLGRFDMRPITRGRAGLFPRRRRRGPHDELTVHAPARAVPPSATGSRVYDRSIRTRLRTRSQTLSVEIVVRPVAFRSWPPHQFSLCDQCAKRGSVQHLVRDVNCNIPGPNRASQPPDRVEDELFAFFKSCQWKKP